MALDIVVGILSIVFIAATALPLLRDEAWWIRIFDFPRSQIAIGGVVLLALSLTSGIGDSAAGYLLLILLIICVLYQVIRMVPYTRLAPKQVQWADPRASLGTFSLLIANVLMTNREGERFVELIDSCSPDVFLAVETDEWWAEQLQVLENRYPHTVKCPLDNTYGMLLFSRLPLIEPEVRFLIENDIPSIHTEVELLSGRRIQLRCVHPKPPYPREAEQSTERDAELLVVGRAVKGIDEPVVVAGDLNDVAWSHTTHLFQRISGLLDPRRGRGFYNTFHAQNPILRWPLDHVFHSDDFKLIELKRLPAFGSDHFPVLVRLSLEAGASIEQQEPQADVEEEHEADEKVRRAEVS